jgi:hypothetical protein
MASIGYHGEEENLGRRKAARALVVALAPREDKGTYDRYMFWHQKVG